MIAAESWLRALPVEGGADDDAVLLRAPGSGQWLRLEATARRIWELLEYPATPEQVSALLAAEYDAPIDEVESEVRRAIGDFAELGLVAETSQRPSPLRNRYLALLKKAVSNSLYPELEMQVAFLEQGGEGLAGRELQRRLRDISAIDAAGLNRIGASKRQGSGLQRFPHTMVGLFRLSNLERCAERIFADAIPGDFLEAGVCQGGASIFMRGLQVAHGEVHRKMWVVDSFQGVPPSAEREEDAAYPVNLEEARQPWLACSEERVRAHFARYDLLDPQVAFLPGWVAETLPSAPIGPLALLRLDVDLYSATADCLDLLYDKVSPGGFVVVDDYGYLPCCRDAVDHFRARRNIAEPLQIVDYTGVYWRKAA